MKIFRSYHRCLRFLFLLFAIGTVPSPFSLKAEAVQSDQAISEAARNLVHLLSYIGADYGGAVQEGKVVSVPEYEEQKEFSLRLVELVSGQPLLKENRSIREGVESLQKKILEKASAAQVHEAAQKIQQEVFSVTGLSRSPKTWPSLKHGKQLYDQQCTQCHGVSARGDGPSSGGLEPKPTNFWDPANSEKSPFQFFNTIRLGVPGTAMAAFSHFSEEDTWDLAFYLMSLRHQGAAVGTLSSVESSHPWSLEQVASLSDQKLMQEPSVIHQDAQQLKAGLQQARTFEVVESAQTLDLLALTERLILESLTAFEQHHYDLAKTKAVSAYLDGIEPLEPRLRVADADFTLRLEEVLSDYRRKIDRRVSVEELKASTQKVQEHLKQARKVLEAKTSSFWITLSMSAGIFLREALESALLLITLLGVLKTLGNPTAIYYIHGGWIGACVAGLITWVFSGWLVQISGMKREMLEGTISLLGVGVLLYFGFWLHSKTEMGRWRQFINDLVKDALNNQKLLGLGLVAFMGVFREAFETVLFLRALLIESPGQQVALGMGVGLAFLGVLLSSALAVKWSAKLPLKQLFSLSSLMMLILAFILLGKSVHSFQEVGLLSSTPLRHFVRIDALGIFPVWESVIPQAILVGVSFGFWLWNKIPSKWERLQPEESSS